MICNTGAAKLNTATTLNTLNTTNPALRAVENVSDSIASFSGPGGGGGRSKSSIVSSSSPPIAPTPITMPFLLSRFLPSFNGVVVFIAFASCNVRPRQDVDAITTTDGLLLLDEDEEQEHEEEVEKLAVVLAMKALLLDVVWIASMSVYIYPLYLTIFVLCEEKISNVREKKRLKYFRVAPRARKWNELLPPVQTGRANASRCVFIVLFFLCVCVVLLRFFFFYLSLSLFL